MGISCSIAVSVILPAYNAERYIDEAIQSVLAQEGISFELLIGDDASTDTTWTHVQSYCRDPRVRVWRFRVHRGAGAVRNHLLQHARGRYLSICDADDVMLPGHLLVCVKALQASPGVGVVQGDRWVINDWGDRVELRVGQGPQKKWDLVQGHVGHPGAMIRRSVMQAVGGYREKFWMMEDYDLFLRLAEVTRFRPTRKALYLYRIHPGSLSHNPSRIQQATLKELRRDAILRRYGYRVPW